MCWQRGGLIPKGDDKENWINDQPISITNVSFVFIYRYFRIVSTSSKQLEENEWMSSTIAVEATN